MSWDVFAKKSADILSFRISFITISKHDPFSTLTSFLLQDVGTGPNDYVNLWQKPPQQGHEMIILDDLEPSQNFQKKSTVSTSTHFLQGKMSQTDNFEDPR